MMLVIMDVVKPGIIKRHPNIIIRLTLSSGSTVFSIDSSRTIKEIVICCIFIALPFRLVMLLSNFTDPRVLEIAQNTLNSFYTKLFKHPRSSSHNRCLMFFNVLIVFFTHKYHSLSSITLKSLLNFPQFCTFLAHSIEFLDHLHHFIRNIIAVNYHFP